MAIGYLLALYRPRHAPVAAVLFMLCCSAVVLAIWYNWSEVSAPFLTEEALTGRGSIWIALQGFAQDHPFGAGFGSFWNISGHQPIDSYVGPRSWVAKQSSGHNGYLDLLVTIGPVGLALTVAAFAFFPMLRLLSTPSIPNNRRAFIASLLVYTLSANFTESTLLDRDQSVYVVLLFAISLVAVAGKTQTPQSPKPSRLLQKSRLRFGQWVGSAF
jgi:O-antigen ligase